jgi:IS30 family transposase
MRRPRRSVSNFHATQHKGHERVAVAQPAMRAAAGSGRCDRYRATLADENARARARRPKCCKLANSPRLPQAVAKRLRLDWSPEQIAGWLKRTHPGDERNQVSHETSYRSLFVQARGVLKKELLSHLRSKRSMRRSKAGGSGRLAVSSFITRGCIRW